MLPPVTRAWDEKPAPRQAQVFAEGFEGDFPGAWTIGDSNLASGEDYWGNSSWRAHSGSLSAWSAAVGWNDYRSDWNVNLHEYDNGMDASMYRTVDLSGYLSAWVDYWYWLESENGWDGLQVMYYEGGIWTYVDTHEGDSGVWTSSSVAIPTTATRVGFMFYSDSSIIYEGAYVDDVEVWGELPPLLCTASIVSPSPALGYENVTAFSFSGGATLGTPPYTFLWSFGDGGSGSGQAPTHTYLTVGTYYPTLHVTDAASNICNVSAGFASVGHAGPITVQIKPSTLSVDPKKTQSLAAVVTDAAGHNVTSGSVITWSVSKSSCGTVSSLTGDETTTFRAADAGAGEQCQVTASVTYRTWEGSDSVPVTVNGLSTWVLVAVLAISLIVIFLVVAFVLLRRRKKRGVITPIPAAEQASAQPVAGAPPGVAAVPQGAAPPAPVSPPPAPAYGPPSQPAAPMCPRCGRPIQHVPEYNRWFCPEERIWL